MAKKPAPPTDGQGIDHSPTQPTIERVKLSSFRPAVQNPNRGNANSVPMIVNSITMNGAGRPMLADKDGEMIAGSHSIQGFIDAGFDEAIVIKSDGSTPVIFQRTDIDIESAQGRSLQIGDNVLTVKGYSQDDELMAALLGNIAAEDAKLVQAAGFNEQDVRHLMNQLSDPDNPYDEWVGMPEFEQEDQLGLKSVIVHFETEDDIAAFAKLVNQTITMSTKYIWYPEQEKFNAKALRVTDEP